MGLGKVFKRLREKKKVSLSVAAKGIGITKGYLHQVEAQIKVPTVATLSQMARYYDTKLYKVFKELDA